MNVRINERWDYEDCGALTNAVMDVSFNETGSVEPVILAEVKIFSKIDTSSDDALITELITAARQMCEGMSNLSFVLREVTATINNALGGMYLPYGPVVGDVMSVEDYSGVAYDNPEFRGGQFKLLKYPVTEYAVVIYNAGYSVLPKRLKTALLNQVDYLYNNRGEVNESSFSPIAKMLLKPYSRV